MPYNFKNKKDIENFVDLQTAMECEYLVIAIPAQELRNWLKENFVLKVKRFFVASKGIEASTGEF